MAPFSVPVQTGEPTRGVLIRPYTVGDCNALEDHSIVWYTPYLQGPCGHIWSRVKKNRGMLPHEILFHELVHALRDAAGHGNRLAALSGGLKGDDNTEELIAVVVTNILMTDVSNSRSDRVGLRRDHGYGQLSSDLAGSLDFFKSSKHAFPRIAQFCCEDGWFTQKLANVNATFNPIAAFYRDQVKAKRASESATAAVRDFLM